MPAPRSPPHEGVDDRAFLGPAAAEEVHAKLAKVAGVQIPAWRSVLKSVQVGEDHRRIAEILRVGHLANCTITEAGDQIELATTIIDPEKEAVLWSGRQTYASADLVYALSEISRGIADALRLKPKHKLHAVGAHPVAVGPEPLRILRGIDLPRAGVEPDLLAGIRTAGARIPRVTSSGVPPAQVRLDTCIEVVLHVRP